MQQSFEVATRVPLWRVAVVVCTLIVLPSWALTARHGAAEPQRKTVSSPVGAETAAAAPLPFDEAAWDPDVVHRIDADVFGLALGAASCAVRSGAVNDPATLTIIDYSKPSTSKRFWVLDLDSRELLYEELVAHGQGSGGNYATLFSNEPETHRTSLGLFVTEGTYVGRNGYSLRLNGLDADFNDRARARAIVIHGAPYVSPAFAKAQGRLGRSWGCPALSEAVARDVIDRVKGGSLVFAYYPDAKWLHSSTYLGDCAAAN